MSTTYRVFKRRAWARKQGKWIPMHTRGVTVRTGVTSIEEARRICAEGPANVARDAGREYRGLTFYEFEKE